MLYKGDVILKYFITYAALLFSPGGVYYILSIPFSKPTHFYIIFQPDRHLHIFTATHQDSVAAAQGTGLAVLQMGANKPDLSLRYNSER